LKKYFIFSCLKKKIKDGGFILITTYSMIAKNREEAKTDRTLIKKKILSDLCSKEWGLCILDEVQVVPAKTFQRVLLQIKAHFKLGLTATLIREDDKIENLNYMIGPKLYEENWLDLVNQGFLARPYCIEIRSPMTPEFANEYKCGGREKDRLLYAGNPNKFLVLQYLIRRHEERGDKIIVFGNRPAILEYYAKKLKMPVLHGKVKADERVVILEKFQTSKKINTIFLSSVGDTAIDLPSANVVIQISAHFGSRKQEAQRLGRIMRPKENEFEEYNAFFYTVVSLATDETLHASKRQSFLIDQGFSFEIVSQSQLKLPHDLIMSKSEEQVRFLEILLTNIRDKEESMKNQERESSGPSDDSDYESSEEEQEYETKNPLYNNMVYIEKKF
jgi:DNA excision repair protein ERCC-3